MLDTSGEVIYFSRFRPESAGNGGFRRTAQIAESLHGIGCSFVTALSMCPQFYSSKYVDSPEFQVYAGEEPLSSAYLEKWTSAMRTHVAYLHHVSWLWVKELQQKPPLKMAIVDDPIYFAPLVKYLALNGIPIVAHCHNIEALSKSQLMDEHQMELLNYEIELLSLCALAVTISREEAVFLTNFGINTLYYPYFPVGESLNRMLRIREKRRATSKKDFLMLGTANNPPTMLGMMHVMTRWNDISKSMNGARLFVGGYGTEPLNELADGEHVVYKGVLTNEELDEMLGRVKACVVYQGDGSGALTKICEFLLAGVPVFANSHAARSYYHLPGIVEFSDIYDLAKASAIVNSLDMQAAAPEPPDSTLLLLRIKELASETGHLNVGEIKNLVETMLSKSDETDVINNQPSGWKKIVQEAIREYDNRLKDECYAISAERDAIMAERDALRKSLSWTLTAPLRRIGNIFKRR